MQDVEAEEAILWGKFGGRGRWYMVPKDRGKGIADS